MRRLNIVGARKQVNGSRQTANVPSVRCSQKTAFQLPGTDCYELAVVVEVEELFARRLILLPRQIRELVVAVEMQGVGAPASLPTLQEAILDPGSPAAARRSGTSPTLRKMSFDTLPRPDATRPTHHCWYTEGSLPI